MSLTQDAFSIGHFFDKEDTKQRAYLTREYTSIDSTQSAGFNQRVDFNFTPYKFQFVDLSQACIELDITTQSPTVFTDASAQSIAVKGSDLAKIRALRLRTEGNITIYENDNLHLSSELRLFTQKDREWVKDHGDEISYSLDRSDDDYRGMLSSAQIAIPSVIKSCSGVTNNGVMYVSGGAAGSVPSFTSTIGAGLNGENPNYNKGFAQRCASFQQKMALAPAQPGYAAGVGITNGLRQVITLPLALLSDFFKNLDYTQYGTPTTLEATLNLISNQGYSVVCSGNRAQVNANASAARTQDNSDVLSWCITPNTIPKLWFHQITYDTPQLSSFLKMYEMGYEKEIEYSTYEPYAQFINVRSGVAFTHQVTPSCTNPVRIYALAQPTGVANGTTWPSPLVTGANYLTHVDLYVAGKRQNNTPIISPGQQFELLKRAMNTSMDNDSVGLIDYSQFLRTHRILVLDCTRLKGGGVPDPNTPLDITVKATPVSADGGNLDVLYIIERKVKLKWVTKSGEPSKFVVTL